MIDLHCHILPGIDDGAADLDDAVAMARTAAEDGVEVICATPHIRHDHDVLLHEVTGRAERLTGELERRGIPLRVLPGGELAAARVGQLDFHELQAISLGGAGRWILLEPDPGPVDDRLEDAAAELAAYGCRVLIAHPERHAGGDLRARLRRIVTDGALVQLTADTLLDPATRSGALELAADGLVHVLGSDAHSSHAGRSTRLSAAFDALSEVEPAASHMDWIRDEAPRAIVAGGAAEAPF